MLVLDTNHYREIAAESVIGKRLAQRLHDSGDEAFLAIVTAEEVLKGWLAQIQPHRQRDRGVSAYHDFQESLDGLSKWFSLPWTHDAADIFDDLRRQKVNIGTMDLRIAAIALEYGAKVLTRNLVDFEKVPELLVENWLD
ncbi:MAG: type II toxin-antitoxin system VapC family toxin [Prosthecobacter sp.]|uniref:type II toxin-antitoxin system VapC family toxin n=1 Tax=Prosthecobacter sp. TaxID=1965333 RepID=UPI0038FD7BDE